MFIGMNSSDSCRLNFSAINSMSFLISRSLGISIKLVRPSMHKSKSISTIRLTDHTPSGSATRLLSTGLNLRITESSRSSSSLKLNALFSNLLCRSLNSLVLDNWMPDLTLMRKSTWSCLTKVNCSGIVFYRDRPCTCLLRCFTLLKGYRKSKLTRRSKGLKTNGMMWVAMKLLLSD